MPLTRWHLLRDAARPISSEPVQIDGQASLHPKTLLVLQTMAGSKIGEESRVGPACVLAYVGEHPDPTPPVRYVTDPAGGSPFTAG